MSLTSEILADRPETKVATTQRTLLDLRHLAVVGVENRLAAARQRASCSAATERYFDWVSNHAPTATERVLAGEVAVEWARTADRNRKTVLEFEEELRWRKAAELSERQGLNAT